MLHYYFITNNTKNLSLTKFRYLSIINWDDPKISSPTHFIELGRRLTPSERVARLLRQADSHLGHLQHPLFTEMETLGMNCIKIDLPGEVSVREKVLGGKSYSLENSLRESIFREDLFLYNFLPQSTTTS